ncbi:MAG: hypothetical protein L0I17_03605, partial [Actinomycetia bacterium]|nr:hypothetical protein [Actinomycetes bacterium]
GAVGWADGAVVVAVGVADEGAGDDDVGPLVDGAASFPGEAPQPLSSSPARASSEDLEERMGGTFLGVVLRHRR